MIKAVLFDLDGTLLPMDMDIFVKTFFGLLINKLCTARGYDQKQFADSVWKSMGAMAKNDGSKTNEQAWWDSYLSIYGEEAKNDGDLFFDFYTNEFQQVAAVCGHEPKAAQVIKLVKEKGLRPILATNPLFPQISTASRIKWAGLDRNDFEFFTTYEDFHYSKPSLDYYKEVLEKAGLTPAECVMVGNDATEDMAARQLGMKVFLLTDCLLNKNGDDISQYPNGNFDDLLEFINNL